MINEIFITRTQPLANTLIMIIKTDTVHDHENTRDIINCNMIVIVKLTIMKYIIVMTVKMITISVLIMILVIMMKLVTIIMTKPTKIT